MLGLCLVFGWDRIVRRFNQFYWHVWLCQSTHSVAQSNDLMGNDCGFLGFYLHVDNKKACYECVTLTTISAQRSHLGEMVY